MLTDVVPIARHRLLPDFNFDTWIGVQVPAWTPEHAAARINAAINHVVRQPEVREGLEGPGATVVPAMTLRELDTLFKTEVARYRAMASSLAARQ